MASNASAMASCGSIWIVSGLYVDAQALHEALGEARPVDLRGGGHVRVEVAGGAVDLAEQLDRGEAPARAPQAMRDVRHLLAERGGRGRLAVGAREHRHVGVLRGERVEARDDGVDRGQQDAVARRPAACARATGC